MLKSISSTHKIKIEETPFDILSKSTEPRYVLRVKPIVVRKIGFLLEIDWYSCD